MSDAGAAGGVRAGLKAAALSAGWNTPALQATQAVGFILRVRTALTQHPVAVAGLCRGL